MVLTPLRSRLRMGCYEKYHSGVSVAPKKKSWRVGDLVRDWIDQMPRSSLRGIFLLAQYFLKCDEW